MERKNGSAIQGLKVLDLGQMVAAPYAASMLADMGADVLKIELPGSGDMSRVMLPKERGVSTYHAVFNRGKRGMTLNLKSDAGKKILLELIRRSDVVLSNFRPGVMERLGFSYDVLRTENPRIICAMISGYGQEGLYSTRAAFDPVAQAMSGIMSVTGSVGAEPVRCGAPIADILAAQNAVIAILAALEYRNRTGVGQQIDIALVDSCIAAMSSQNQVYLSTGKVPAPLGNGFEASAPGNSYPTADGSYVMILAGRDAPWRTLAHALELDELIDLPQYATVDLRAKNREELDLLISEKTKRFTAAELMQLMLDVKLPASVIMNTEDVVTDPHFRNEREMFVSIDHPILGKVTVTNSPIKMSETNPYIKSGPPSLGQDNEWVLSNLGYSEEDICTFLQQGII